MQTNTLAYAKVTVNKRLNMLRLLVTFDNTKRDKNDNIIITANNAAYISGDLCNASADADTVKYSVAYAIKCASLQLRTNNILLV